MTEFTEDFEGGTNGTTPTAPGTTAFDAITGSNSTITHSTIRSILGSTSLRILNPTSTVNLYQLFGTPRTVVYQRVYWYAADMTNGANVMNTLNGTTSQSNIQTTAAGALRLRDATTVVATSALTIATGQWYRFELFADYVAGTQTLRIFTGANLHGTTPDDTITGALTTGNFNRAAIGTAAANTLDWFWDCYAEDPSGWIGPAIASVTGEILMENGFPLGMETFTPLLLET